MVLRIKEREEAIQLLAMDPQACGKLLTLHRNGNRVDVHALRDQIPLQQDAEKGPKLGCHGNKRLRQWKSVFMDASSGSGIYVNIQEEELDQGSPEGPTRVGARPPASWLPRCFLDVHSKSPGLRFFQKRSSRRFHSVWIPFLRNTEICKKKQQFALGLRLIGQSQK